MSNRGIFSALGDLFTTFGSAVAASRAVEAGRARSTCASSAWIRPCSTDSAVSEPAVKAYVLTKVR